MIPVGSSRSSLVEKFPSVQITDGSISSTWRSRYSSQLAISIGCGSRLPGGRHLRVFAMNTSERLSPISSSSVLEQFPARPTNGMPCSSSLAPGASPTNIRSASALPAPKTTVFRVAASSGQRVQARAFASSSFSASRRSSGRRVRLRGRTRAAMVIAPCEMICAMSDATEVE